jgi:hypothetical protein
MTRLIRLLVLGVLAVPGSAATLTHVHLMSVGMEPVAVAAFK